MQKNKIIACEVFKEELLKGLEISLETCIFLPQELHRTPDLLKVELQKQIDLLDQQGDLDCIYLGYGLCGNGVVGLKSSQSKIIIPKSEDCISVLLGLRHASKCHVNRTTSYFLSAGWIAYGSDGWKEYQRCLELFDHETAYWCIKEMIKYYETFILINNGMASYLNDQVYVQKMSKFFGLNYEEVEGSLDWLASMFKDVNSDTKILVEPGISIQSNMFTCGD
ncbi:MAG TPA: hypothetical protein DEF42_05655 [Desulfosporosinus sp.]|nr:hypothetical protein [Desulfosporosinus sp.]